MPPKPRPTPRGDYVETETGNKVSRRAQLYGTQHIFLSGRAVISPQVLIRGDLRPSSYPSPPSSSTGTGTGTGASAKNAVSSSSSSSTPTYATSVSIGRYTFLSPGCIITPPCRLQQGVLTYQPCKIGEHVFIGAGCVIEAGSIGDHVVIGAGAIVGKNVVLKDGVKVLEGSVVPAGMVVASGSVVGGRPGRVVGEVGDGWGMYEGMEGGDMRELWRGVGA